MSLICELLHPIGRYPMFKGQEQRDGSTPPSKSQDPSTWVHLNQHTSNYQSHNKILLGLIPCHLPNSRCTSHQTNECYCIPIYVACWEGSRNNGRFGGATASDQDAPTTALLHCPEPGHLHVGTGEGEFPFVASQCDFSHKCNKRREQVFFFCHEGRGRNFDKMKKAA
jgi:hypothetical protein